MNGDYKKVFHSFNKYNLVQKNENFLILAAKALFRNKEYSLCKELLTGDILSNKKVHPKISSTKKFLLGKCYEFEENLTSAKSMFIECLAEDPTFFNSFQKLLSGHMIHSHESIFILN